MKIPKEIENFYERAQQPRMPQQTKVKVQQYLTDLEKQNFYQRQRPRHLVRTVSVVLAAVSAFVIATTLSLHQRSNHSIQLANSPHHVKRPQQSTTYDYQSVIGFTPMVPVTQPKGWISTYSSAFVSMTPTYKQGKFTIKYGSRTITEQSGKYASAQYPPKKYYKKVTKDGVTIYQLTSFNWAHHPEAESMVFLKGGVRYTLSVTAKTPVQQCIQVMRNLSKPYTKAPMGIQKEYTAVNQTAKLKQFLPSQFVLPQSGPRGYKLVNVTAYQGSGATALGKVMNPWSLHLTYNKGAALGRMNFEESHGSSYPFVGQKIKAGKITVHYSPAQGISWYDPTREIVVKIYGGQNVSKNALVTFAKDIMSNLQTK